jgi:hypothetical protein
MTNLYMYLELFDSTNGMRIAAVAFAAGVVSHCEIDIA